ncbi:MAG: Gfo/Idh/MocA family oxidoreductase [Spiribacter sp.]|jgi:predicted dehydrogenase|nr:Gfo/Idh/MocA family oxidoreductase [Spiribacter sp.]MDR9489296.1 Gfo/Idh/MocA family oxidoreductase [Spiribacter sp.]
MSRIRTAVIGVGYLGHFHAQKYAAHPDAELVAVVDADSARAEQVAEALGCLAMTDTSDLIGQIDAASVVSPTRLHHSLALPLIKAGVHLLIEKPITTTLAEADALINAAKTHHTMIQVGHLERFNPAMVEAASVLTQPLFIESHRIAPFNPRGADVSVVLDLMIHDIDLILELVASPLEKLDASGAAVISNDIDIANARLSFADGCVANVTASRVSPKAERRMRIFQTNAYIALDLQAGSLNIQRRDPDHSGPPTMEQITKETHTPGKRDALADEIDAFIHAVRAQHAPIVSAEDGRRALSAAIDIGQQLSRNSA